MINKIKTLVWLRFKQVTKNKSNLMMILMPIMFAFFYNKVINHDGSKSLTLLSSVLNMTFVASMGSIVLNIISEEKEKNNMRTLLLSGVSGFEYIVSTLIFPVIIGTVSIVGYPLIFDIDLTGFTFKYYIVSIVCALANTLLYLLIGLATKNQASGQTIGTLAMFVVMLVPLFAPMDETMAKILDYTYMNGFNEFFAQQAQYSLTSQSFIVSLVWVGLLLIATIFMYQRGKKKTTSPKNPFLGFFKVKASA